MSDKDVFSLIKKAALTAVDAGYPCNWIAGTVETISPLTIRTEQQELLDTEYLWLTDAVRDYEVDIEVSHVTETRAGGSGDAAFASHDHDYKGRKRITVCNGLHVGEKVFMVQKKGGQAFIVLGRVFAHTHLSGQWL
ncbi:DUF2577 domain-containing protein [Sporomusa paucivorans]|uniref:DUF2577 domain-containing protein n=1 Tax=Sporomusa paucivorans TaxID=2376 RepID=UPI00357094E4